MFIISGFGYQGLIMQNLLSVISIVAGLAGLIWSADKFVQGASTTANNLGVSPLVIGLTVVAFGTSAPEIFISAIASLKGAPELALGNALGSNIANIGLVLGITTLVCPIKVPISLLKQELPVLLITTFSLFFMFHDGLLNWADGMVLLLILLLFIWRLAFNKTKVAAKVSSEASEDMEFIADISTQKALVLMLIGLVLLIISSNILVFGAKNIALAFGVSELVVGLTIIAIGTSLPELAVSITSALKGHHELAVGNIIGSNIFNLVLVLPIPAFLAPVVISPVVIWRDYGTMLILTVLISIMMYVLGRQNKKIGRKLGAVLLLLYLAYTGTLLLTQ